MRRILAALTIAVSVVTLLVTAPSAVAASSCASLPGSVPSSPGTLTVSPYVNPGPTVFTGTGYAPGAKVHVGLYPGTAGPGCSSLGTFTADRHGVATFTVNLPDQYGGAWVVAGGKDRSGNVLYDETWVNILPPLFFF